MHEVGLGLQRRDEVAADLVAAIRAKEVTLKTFGSALESGVESIEMPHPALTRFFTTIEATPDWVDWAEVERGARVCREMGQNALDVLAYGSLLGGYRFQAANNVLTASGGLSTTGALRRVGETTKWWVECVTQDGLRRHGEGFKLTAHVRLMHQLISVHFEQDTDWDHSEYGVPVNATDQAATLALFSTTFLLQVRMLGVPVLPREGQAVMHLWRYIGWLLGIEEQWIPLSEHDGRRMIYRFVLSQATPKEDGHLLADALIKKVPRGYHYSHLVHPRRILQTYRAANLGTYFQGRRGMREVGLSPLIPLHAIARIPLNLLVHGALKKLPVTKKIVAQLTRRKLDLALDRHFGPQVQAIGSLDAAHNGRHNS
ncbi:MAG TPA: oxygenase MpaB family protein [Vicinamibacterales bacterium]|jgi:hypothetical protein|nr:oxygenase MpaB family protein [Vicinamibacterales bacterium]